MTDRVSAVVRGGAAASWTGHARIEAKLGDTHMTCLLLLASCLGSETEPDSEKHDADASESVPAWR